jgi:hypothetical protein
VLVLSSTRKKIVDNDMTLRGLSRFIGSSSNCLQTETSAFGCRHNYRSAFLVILSAYDSSVSFVAGWCELSLDFGETDF